MFRSVSKMFRSNMSKDDSSSRPKQQKINDESVQDIRQEMKINDSNIVLNRMKQLYCEQLMTDITLVVEGREFPAHRLVLCAMSDVFQVMLMKPEWSEWHESRIVLQEPKQCVPVFHLFLEYFYSGEITLTYTNVMPLLTLADKYNLTNLSKMCVLYMCWNIPYAATHNYLISWLQYTLACGHNDVFTKCLNYVKWNFETISETDDFRNFNPTVFVYLIQQNDLIVRNEMDLYDCVVKWLNYQNDRLRRDADGASSSSTDDEFIENEMKSLTKQIMVHIRFPMMSPRQLAELLLSPLINKYKEFFVERMAIGMIYHSGQEDRILDLCYNKNEFFLFTPRLYTCDNFSSVLTIDNFAAMPSYGARTYMFASHLNLAEYKGDETCDWIVDFFPRGVWFKKFFLIVWQGTVEVPEYVIETVRLSLTCKSEITVRVKVSVLVFGEKSNIEFVTNVIERIHTFSDKEKIINVDDLIPFTDLNPQVQLDTNDNRTNYHLIGPTKSTVKICIIITPIDEFCNNSVTNVILD